MISRICVRCGSTNIVEINNSNEKLKKITVSCKDCGYKRTFIESITPRKYKQERKEEEI